MYDIDHVAGLLTIAWASSEKRNISQDEVFSVYKNYVKKLDRYEDEREE